MRVAERLIPLAQGSNFRDIGGYAAADGKRVRWGSIYRSGATAVLTDDDIARVTALGLTTIVDLRSSEERILAPTRLTGIRCLAVDYSMMAMFGDRPIMANGVDLYRSFPAFFAPHLRIVFDVLICKQMPMVYNCSAGQDRTGFITAMILSAFGVPRDRIIADYHLSTSCRQPQHEMPNIDEATAGSDPVAGIIAAHQQTGAYSKVEPLKDALGTAFLDGAFAEIDARWATVDAYLQQEIGINQSDLALLREACLE